MISNSPISTRALDRGAMATRTKLDAVTMAAWHNHRYGSGLRNDCFYTGFDFGKDGGSAVVVYRDKHGHVSFTNVKPSTTP